DARMEHGVEVDVDQVVEILQVLARDRIAGLVRICHGVEEGIERALHQLHKRVLDRVLARPAQHGMLQDVGDAGRVARQGPEGDAEYLILVIIDEREQFGAGPRMAIAPGDRVDLREAALGGKLEPMGKHRLESSRAEWTGYGANPRPTSGWRPVVVAARRRQVQEPGVIAASALPVTPVRAPFGAGATAGPPAPR